jgi:hypothetical protein
MTRERLTFVIAAYNEALALPLLHPRLCAVLDGMPDIDGHILYVDDGSHDGTWEVIAGLAQADARVSALKLSRNFGKEAALTAGLDLVREGAAMILDADGQDPPELVPQFVARWREGHDNVYGTRMARDGEAWIKRATAAMFYRVMGRLSRTPIPADTGDFRLLSPRALSALREMRERHRFMKGFSAGSASSGGGALSPPRARGRHQQVQPVAAVELRPGRHHRVLDRAAAGGDLPGAGNRGGGLRVRPVGDRQGGAVRRPGGGLADDDGGDPVPGRGAVDRAGPDRRVPGAAVRRVQAAAVVPG